MKKIISAVLALTVLLSMCACNGDVAETETSDVSSVPVISIDPSSMLSSDAPSSDIPSNEGSKPDENASSEEPTPPPTPEEEEKQARIQKALNNPGASLDYDVFLVDAPEEGNEWKLLRYNMEEEELYDEFSFSPKNATGSYTVEFTDEYVGNILKVTFEDGTNCYIDVEKNKFYNSSEFKGLSKTLSVTKRNIGVTKNGQYEVWTTSHPDHGKVYYSELNEDDNLLLTVFLKNNKYTFTSYDYETKTLKNLFTISEKPEVKLLQDGWFMFRLNSGATHLYSVNNGGKYPLNNENKRGIESDTPSYDAFSLEENFFKDFMQKAKENKVVTVENAIWWYENQGDDVCLYCYGMEDRTYIRRRTDKNANVAENSEFFRFGEYIALKLCEKTDGELIKRGDMWICSDIYTTGKLLKRSSHAYYVSPDNSFVLCNDETDETVKWANQPLFEKKDGEIFIKSRNAMNTSGVYYEGNIWFVRPMYVKSEDKKYTYLYRYDTVKNRTYLVKKYSWGDGFFIDVYDGCSLTVVEVNGTDYINITTGYAYDPHVWYIKLSTLEGLFDDDLRAGRSYRTIVKTDREDLVFTDTYIEVWEEHPEYGYVRDVQIIPNTSKAVMVFDERWASEVELPCRAMIYDYATGEFTEMMSWENDADILICDVYNERYIEIVVTINESVDTHYWIDAIYIYNIETNTLNKAKEGWLRSSSKQEGFCGNNNGMILAELVLVDREEDLYDEVYYFYNIETKKLTKLLTIEGINHSDIYTDKGIFVRTKRNRDYYATVGALYHTTLTKSTLISESVSTYYVCEDQGYVMYYEEQADGSFEWKYYNF